MWNAESAHSYAESGIAVKKLALFWGFEVLCSIVIYIYIRADCSVVGFFMSTPRSQSWRAALGERPGISLACAYEQD